MNATTQKRFFVLLDALRADFPRRKETAETLMQTAGLTEPIELVIEAPASVDQLLTFKPAVSRKLTPMLEARFAYTGTWRDGFDVWLAADQMAKAMRSRDVLDSHRALGSTGNLPRPCCLEMSS